MSYWNRGWSCAVLQHSLRRIQAASRIPLPFSRGLSSTTSSPSQQPDDGKQSAAANPMLLVGKFQDYADNTGGQQRRPPLLQMILVDDRLLATLEANLGSDGPKVLGCVELAMLDPRIRQFYHNHKPPVPGCLVRDITYADYRPHMHVTTVDTQKGEVLVTLLPKDNEESSPSSMSITRKQSEVLTGCPIDRTTHLSSEWQTMTQNIKWMWARGHLEGDRSITLREAGGPHPLRFPVDHSSVFASDLLQALPIDTSSGSMKFNNQTYVKGALELVIDGTVVSIFVNIDDARTDASGPSARSLLSAFRYWLIRGVAVLAMGVSGWLFWWLVSSQPYTRSPVDLTGWHTEGHEWIGKRIREAGIRNRDHAMATVVGWLPKEESAYKNSAGESEERWLIVYDGSESEEILGEEGVREGLRLIIEHGDSPGTKG